MFRVSGSGYVYAIGAYLLVARPFPWPGEGESFAEGGVSFTVRSTEVSL